jgi:hypothetical protein
VQDPLAAPSDADIAEDSSAPLLAGDTDISLKTGLFMYAFCVGFGCFFPSFWLPSHA